MTNSYPRDDEMREMMEAMISDDQSFNMSDLTDELSQTGGRMAKRIHDNLNR